MVEKKVKKFGQGSPLPFRAMSERKHFFLQEGFPYSGINTHSQIIGQERRGRVCPLQRLADGFVLVYRILHRNIIFQFSGLQYVGAYRSLQIAIFFIQRAVPRSKRNQIYAASYIHSDKQQTYKTDNSLTNMYIKQQSVDLSQSFKRGPKTRHKHT